MTPEISIIICTRNRAHLLEDAVAALVSQSAPSDAFEVLLIDNGSTDATPQVIVDLIKRFPQRPIRSSREDAPGLSNARNCGWRAAAAPLVAFIDDDALAPPEYVANLIEAFRRYPEAASIGGRILPRFEAPPPDWLTPWLHGYLSLQDFGPRTRPYRRREYAYGCNMAFRKEALERVGGFDPVMVHGEDKDVAVRVRYEGASWYDPSILVFHLIPAERLRLESLRNLAKRTGSWERRRVARAGVWPERIKLIEYIGKQGAAGFLGLGYLLAGRVAAARALWIYRLGFLDGFISAG